MAANTTLKNDEERLLSGNVSRAAAAFPFWVDSQSDTLIVFQNYWQWKRGISVSMRLRVYSNSGELIVEEVSLVSGLHQEISIKDILDMHCLNEVSGFSEVEILASDENIVFPFPAIMAYYTNGKGEYSCVHAAGRTLLEEEEREESSFDEANFYCRLTSDFSPFIHLFTGVNSYIKNITISIYSAGNQKLKTIELDDIIGSYQSEVVYLKEYLDDRLCAELGDKAGFYIKISGICRGIYPRFVVGNYSKEKRMHYVTHSFRVITSNDPVIMNARASEFLSSIALPTPPNAQLKIKIYPTCGPAEPLRAVMQEELPMNTSLYGGKTEDIVLAIDSEVGKLDTRNVSENMSSAIMIAGSQSVPSRVNCSLEYSAQGSYHPTDIALQLRSVAASRKSNYWGHVENIPGFKSYLLISNILPAMEKVDAAIKLMLVCDRAGKTLSKEKIISAGTCTCIDVKSEFGVSYENVGESNLFLSWRAEVTAGQIQNIYIVSHNEATGAIFGDHSF